MNPVRGRMTHRATIERDTQTATNPYGHVGEPTFEALEAELPCFLYTRRSRARAEDVQVERTAVVEEMALLAPLDADVTERDRVNGVEDRLGNVLLAGVHNIRSVLRHHTHVEIVLQGAA